MWKVCGSGKFGVLAGGLKRGGERDGIVPFIRAVYLPMVTGERWGGLSSQQICIFESGSARSTWNWENFQRNLLHRHKHTLTHIKTLIHS